MVKLANIKFLQKRREAIRAVLGRCLPDFLNRVFLQIIGVESFDTRLPIENQSSMMVTIPHQSSNVALRR